MTRRGARLSRCSLRNRFRLDVVDGVAGVCRSSMGELHLDIIKTKLSRDLKINVNVGTPRVAYKEAISFIILVIMLIVRPTGLFGGRS